MKRYLVVTFALLFVGVSISPGVKSAEPPPFPKNIKERLEVTERLSALIRAQITIPGEFYICLFAAWEQAVRKNPEANDALIDQIDRLIATGADPGDITAMISYGHGIVNSAFAMERKIGIDSIPQNMAMFTEYSKGIFETNGCRKAYYDYETKEALRKGFERFFLTAS